MVSMPVGSFCHIEDRIAAGDDDISVVAQPADIGIVAVLPFHHVVAGPTKNRIGTETAEDGVISLGPDQGVVARTPPCNSSGIVKAWLARIVSSLSLEKTVRTLVKKGPNDVPLLVIVEPDPGADGVDRDQVRLGRADEEDG